MFASWQESCDPREFDSAEGPRHYFADKGPYSQGFGLPRDHAWLWELDRKEDEATKNWCLWTVVLERTPESPLDSKEIQPVNLKENQPWIFTRRSDAEVETALFWSSDVNSWLIGKVPGVGKGWGLKKRASEDETAGWHHRCNAHELGQTLGDGEGQRGVVCCSPWGHKELDVTGRLSNNILSKCHSVCVCVCIGAIIDNSNKIPCFTKQSSQKIISFLDERVINTHTGQGAIS